MTWNILSSFQPSDRDHRAWIQEHPEEIATVVPPIAEEMTT